MSAEVASLPAVEAAIATVEAIAARPELAPADAAAMAATVAAARARLARAEVVLALVGESRAGKSTLQAALERLGVPAGFRLLDTPGLNVADPSEAERAWALIEAEADAVLLISDMQQAVARTTRDAVARIGRLAPHVLLVLTKVDRALANAELAPDPEAELAEARRVAVRRFAAEVGRAPDEVLAVAVAAGPALDDDVAAERLRAALAPMWEVLRAERALVLAARTALLIEGAAAAVRAALERAEAAAQARIAALEAQRLPDPAAWRAEAVTRVAAELADPEGWRTAARAFGVALARRGMRWEVAIRKAVSEEEARAAAAAAAGEARRAIAELLGETRDVAIGALAERASEARERALAGLRARYALAGEIVGAVEAFPEPPALDPAMAAEPLGAGFGEALAAFDADRTKLHLGGAAAGAAVGTAIAPGLGTALGALVGSLGGLLMNLDLLKTDMLRSLQAGLASAEAMATAHILEGGASAEGALAAAIGRDLDAAIDAVRARIDALQAAERERLARARAELAGLLALGARLEDDLAALRAAREQDVARSRGLCGV